MDFDLWEAKWLTSQLSRDILASVGLNLGKWIWEDRRTQQTPLHAGYLSVVGGCSSHIWGYPCWVLNISYTWYGYNLSMYIYIWYCIFYFPKVLISTCMQYVFSKIQHGFLEAISWSFRHWGSEVNDRPCKMPASSSIPRSPMAWRPTRLAIKWWSIGITSHFYVGNIGISIGNIGTGIGNIGNNGLKMIIQSSIGKKLELEVAYVQFFRRTQCMMMVLMNVHMGWGIIPLTYLFFGAHECSRVGRKSFVFGDGFTSWSQHAQATKFRSTRSWNQMAMEWDQQ